MLIAEIKYHFPESEFNHLDDVESSSLTQSSANPSTIVTLDSFTNFDVTVSNQRNDYRGFTIFVDGYGSANGGASVEYEGANY